MKYREARATVERNPPDSERVWTSLYRGAVIATGVWIAGLVLYVVSGGLYVRFLSQNASFLLTGQDPFLFFLIAGVGLFISITMVCQLFRALLIPSPEEDLILIVLIDLIVIGFGLAPFYHAIRMMIRLLPRVPA